MIDRKFALLAPFALALSLGACGLFGGGSSSSDAGTKSFHRIQCTVLC